MVRDEKLRVSYDSKEGILYIIIRDGAIIDSRELNDDVRLEYGPNGEIVGVEIANAKCIAKVMAQEIATILRH